MIFWRSLRLRLSALLLTSLLSVSLLYLARPSRVQCCIVLSVPLVERSEILSGVLRGSAERERDASVVMSRHSLGLCFPARLSLCVHS